MIILLKQHVIDPTKVTKLGKWLFYLKKNHKKKKKKQRWIDSTAQPWNTNYTTQDGGV